MKEVALLTHKKDLVNSWEKEGERIDTSLLLRFTVEFVGERGSSTHKKISAYAFGGAAMLQVFCVCDAARRPMTYFHGFPAKSRV